MWLQTGPAQTKSHNRQPIVWKLLHLTRVLRPPLEPYQPPETPAYVPIVVESTENAFQANMCDQLEHEVVECFLKRYHLSVLYSHRLHHNN